MCKVPRQIITNPQIIAQRARLVEKVSNALSYQFESYTWGDMIDDIPDLTPEERDWAKVNIGYKTYIISQ